MYFGHYMHVMKKSEKELRTEISKQDHFIYPNIKLIDCDLRI